MIKDREPITFLGPPGTGKTQNISKLVLECIEEGIPPERIACVSFTRKAAQESRDRVCREGGLQEDALPYFQTLHSMAYRAGGFSDFEVINNSDLKIIGEAVGVYFETGSSNSENDFDLLGSSPGEGQAYLSLYQMSRSKKVSLEEIHRKTGNYNLRWAVLKRLVDTYESYKKAKHKIDYTDMIENFICEGHPLDIDALFVDEAQDLSTLQWQMVDILRQVPQIQVFTGDDDQAIMTFQGADVDAFLAATSRKEVLQHSYRLPRKIWSEAQNISSRIMGRAPKVWQPRDAEGTVHWHQDIQDVPLNEGSWSILTRTNRMGSIYANHLIREGWVFSRKGNLSIPEKMYEAILNWEELSKGQSIMPPQLRNMYRYIKSKEGVTRGYGPKSKKLMNLDPEIPINMEDAHEKLGLLVDGSKRWHQALDNIDLDTKNYILNALKRGDNVKKPRIKLSTIHGMKGGEDENVLIVPNLPYSAYKEMRRNPNTEHRVFYVAVTRAKENLHIILPEKSKMVYEI
mgnify:CR=1 FL=1